MVSSFIHYEVTVWGIRLDGRIFILVSYVFHFIRINDNVVKYPSNNISIIQGAYVDVDHIDFTAPSAVYDINSWVNNITK